MDRPTTSLGQKIIISTISVVALVLSLASGFYFFFFSQTTGNLIDQQSREITKQIIFNYERYVDSVIETANYLQLLVTNRDVATERGAIQNIFELNTEIKKDVVSVMLFSPDGRVVVGSPVNQSATVIVQKPWFVRAGQEREIFHFSIGPSLNFLLPRQDEVIYVARWVQYRARGVLTDGLLLVELNTEVIIDLSEKTNLGDLGHILILDNDGTLIYASETGSLIDDSYRYIRDRYLGVYRHFLNPIDAYFNVNSLVQTRWRIVTVLNITAVSQTQRRVFLVIGAIFLISLGITVVVAGFISLRVTKPLSELRRIMASIEAGNLGTPIDVGGQKEIVQLAHSFGQMVFRVRELMDRLVAEQTEKRKTALRALQNQINPHFLYNTLDSIVWLAEHDRNEDVISTVVALAKFFRISISRGENFISVADEIEHVRNYLTIQQIRYGDKFHYTMDINPDLLEHRVMKLILQPIVENAIYHGMGDDQDKISIQGSLQGDVMIFRITNTGYGITGEKIKDIKDMMMGLVEQSSVGLKNVYQRLTLYYGEKADVDLSSILDESTTVTLTIPLQVPDDQSSGGQE